MKIVEVNVISVRDNETVSATIIQEQRRSETWNRVNAWDVVSGSPDASRRILLNDDERVVVEGRADVKTVFNREQNAAVPLPRDPVKAEQALRDEAAIKEKNIADEEQRRKEGDEAKQKADADLPRTNLDNPLPASQLKPLGMQPPVVAPAKPTNIPFGSKK